MFSPLTGDAREALSLLGVLSVARALLTRDSSAVLDCGLVTLLAFGTSPLVVVT